MNKLQNNTYIKFNSKEYSTSLIFFIIPILVMVYYFFSRNYIISHTIIEFICTTIALVLTTISMSRHTSKSYNLFTYIGISFISINVVQILHLFYSIKGVSYGLYCFLSLISSYMEYLLIPIAYICYKKKIKYSKYITFNCIIGAIIGIILITAYALYLNFGIVHTERVVFSVSNIILICLFSLGVFLLIFGKVSINNIERIYLIIFITLIGTYDSMLSYMSIKYQNVEPNIFIFAHIIKYTAYYTIYKAISEFLVNSSYNDLYNELLEKEREGEYYNSVLNQRLGLLKELNTMIEKSKNRYDDLINSILDIVIIFSKDNLKYLNKAGRKLLFEKLNLDNNKIYNKNEIIQAISQNTNLKNLKFSLDFEKGNKKSYEIFDLNINEETSMFFIKDVTQYFKLNSLKAELENYMIEENLKKDFFSNISHEFRTPVNVISSALQLNDIYIRDKNKEGLTKSAQNIKQNCFRLIRTINNFIEANKICEGYIKPNLEILNIVEVIESISDEASDYINKMNISFIFDSDEEEVFAKCDKEFLQKIYLNLLSNSLKYSDIGSRIWTNIYVDRDYVTISVRNQTKKISKEEKEDIFEIFAKASQPFSLRKEGSGLGLYISKSLTNLMDGKIDLNIKEDGNEFTVTLKRLNIEVDYDNLEAFLACYNINDLREKIDVEFSDIYMN